MEANTIRSLRCNMPIDPKELVPNGEMWKCNACTMTNLGKEKLCLRCGEPNQGDPPQIHTAVDSTNTRGRKDLDMIGGT